MGERQRLLDACATHGHTEIDAALVDARSCARRVSSSPACAHWPHRPVSHVASCAHDTMPFDAIELAVGTLFGDDPA